MSKKKAGPRDNVGREAKEKKNQYFYGPGRKVSFSNDESQYPKSEAPRSWTPLYLWNEKNLEMTFSFLSLI